MRSQTSVEFWTVLEVVTGAADIRMTCAGVYGHLRAPQLLLLLPLVLRQDGHAVVGLELLRSLAAGGGEAERQRVAVHLVDALERPARRRTVRRGEVDGALGSVHFQRPLRADAV